ncbi:WGR domain protein [Chthoniobacter flavus Ellin428]|uniref:WGR domain protein n=1 Tax=Chthoniobacter flavus Ellin428 TaxID=497964 RepID=B4CUV8_9BACT|nr:DUF4240 domain-containing protein [Chthoniobacter flavus]EDY22346.1 WGR domain protein [Chthoniobacter flavus Ellin428]TCO94640.1 uncharacterized protein DUF4240 [Chthoniobacter flavus]
MTKDKFWELIQRSLDGSSGEIDEQADVLESELMDLSPEEIVSFGEHVEACLQESYSNDLWGAAYIIAGGCSDDGFEYFRRWLVSRGREWFERAVKNPDDLADYPQNLSDSDIEFEEFAYIAPKAYEAKVGKPFPYGKTAPDTLTGEEWEEEEEVFSKRWPKLFSKYW